MLSLGGLVTPKHELASSLADLDDAILDSHLPTDPYLAPMHPSVHAYIHIVHSISSEWADLETS